MTQAISRRLALGGITSTFTLLLAVPAGAQTPSGFDVVHPRGRTALPAAPKRVAVFDLAALDILQALGVDVVGVPKVAYPSYLAGYAADRHAKVGSLFEPDYEALKATRPDLIIVGGRSSAKYAELSSIAPTIDLSTDTAAFIPSVARNILLLGRLFGRQAEAAARTERLLADVQALQDKGAKAGKGLLLFVAGQGISSQPARTRFGILYELTGIAPAITAADLPPAQQAERLAALLAQRDPDWLFVLDRNAATGGEAVAEKLLAGNAAAVKTKAWTKRQVVFLDAPTWYLVGGGLTALENAIAQIGTALSEA